MRIYTGSGDRGRTSLFSGERVSKAHLRIEANGDVDELNSLVGAVAAVLPPDGLDLAPVLFRIQSDLLHMGAWLAVTPETQMADELQEVTEGHIRRVETEINRLEKGLPQLRGFILPGGHISAAWCHVARTVCRRAERRIVGLMEQEAGPASEQHHNKAQIYLNRLSDFLFVLARVCNHASGHDEMLWK